ncbi:uncharacterized protein LOC129719983 [Wyeomyia smithii]|uniref:uncharacterized protein LOC129719983 n=1 Tax=Wyeomyia smithii TaxID=174621 RepID=UPI002467D103|nr:uncharacterized protein LOC129719983 [Wyeomyia smithii]
MALDIKTAAELATLIPAYDGSSGGVKSFVDAVNLVKTIVPAESKPAAIQIILTKLSGKARNLFATTPENYDCITQSLTNNCSDKSNDLAKTNLSNLKLKSADDIQNFSKQVDLLAEKLNETYIREQIPSDAAKRMTLKAAIQTMVENSANSETRMMLKVGKFDNLQEAINVMIENEKPTIKTSNSVVLNATRISSNNRFQDTRQNTQQRNSDGYRRGNAKMPAEKKLKAKEVKWKNLLEAFKRMEDFLANYVPAEHQHEVPLRLDRLEKLNGTFESIQSEYEEFDDSEQFLTANMECRSKVEEQCFRIKASLLSKKPLPVPAPVSQSSSVDSQPVPSGLANVKLPTITLPEFNGDFNDWLTFHDTFVSMIHSSTEISCVPKVHYLLAALKGEAANLIQSVTITAANYSVAWDTLVKRYSNKAILRKKHIRALLKYTKILNNSVDALHRIVDDFQRHTKVLQQLGEPVEHFSSILMELLEDKLDDASLQSWEESASLDEQPTYAKMIEFLLKRTRVLETILINRPQHVHPRAGGHNSGSKKPSPPRVNANAMTNPPAKLFPPCPACEKEKHAMIDCPVFNGLDVKGSIEVVTDKKLCSNCFRSDHFARKCRSNFNCKQCSKRHHSMIHPGPFQANLSTENRPKVDNGPLGAFQISTAVVSQSACDTFSLNTAVKEISKNVILSTVVLLVVDAYGQEHLVRALLDTRSQPNAISERFCQQLHLSRKVVNVPIAGVDGTTTNAKYQVRAEIRSRVSEFKDILDFLILRKVTSDTLSKSFAVSQWKIPDNVQLADPNFNVSQKIDMIIGAGHFYTYLLEGRIRLAKNQLMFVESVFGWIVTGNVKIPVEESPQRPVTCHVATVTPIDELLERFWALEEVSGPNYSLIEQSCENLFCETTTRDSDGRYIVRLPKAPNFSQLIGESKQTALNRFKSLERKLERDAGLKRQYHDFMAEYAALGHMSIVPDDNLDGPYAFYLPHHPVIKASSSTTKVRVVFDGSAKTRTGHSLNEALLVGPVVQDELLTHIVRFRKFPIALVADIEKMYRQVLIHPEDRSFQRILWRFSSKKPISTYELSTVTYSVSPSSFLSTRALQQLANDDGESYPQAQQALQKNMYVDDLISGDSTIEQAIQLRNQLNELLKKGGFNLRKWCSNAPEVLNDLPQDLFGTQSLRKFEPDDIVKTLGMSWEPKGDLFRFDVAIANYQRADLHCFADASEAAYGACIYVRSEAIDGRVKVNLLASKSKVSPLKQLSIPRLELRAAELGSRLYEKIAAALEVKFNAVFFWTDSTVVLHWLRFPPRTWKTYVANRVSVIQSATHDATRLHVAGADNPADLVSRGFSADQLVKSNEWQHGPSWLLKPKPEWPAQIAIECSASAEDMEL